MGEFWGAKNRIKFDEVINIGRDYIDAKFGEVARSKCHSTWIMYMPWRLQQPNLISLIFVEITCSFMHSFN